MRCTLSTEKLIIARFDPSYDDPFDGRIPAFGSAADSKRGPTPADPAVYEDDFEYISGTWVFRDL
jgi:hypothetical protein